MDSYSARCNVCNRRYEADTAREVADLVRACARRCREKSPALEAYYEVISLYLICGRIDCDCKCCTRRAELEDQVIKALGGDR